MTLIDRDEPGRGCSYGNAGALSCGSVAPLAMPGVMRDALTMLLDPAAPLRIPLAYLPKAAPWLMRFVRASRPDAVRRIAHALSSLLATSIEKHADMLRDVGAPDILRRTGQLYLYPDEKALRKDTMSWALRREHGLRVDQLGRADILALEPEVGPDYTVGMFTPEQGMSINPYRQVTAIAADFARRGGRIVRDRMMAIEMEADRVRAVRGENATYPADHAVICAGAWSAQLLAELGYRIPLESQRGYHVAIPSPGIAVGRPVIAADRKVFLTPMEEACGSPAPSSSADWRAHPPASAPSIWCATCPASFRARKFRPTGHTGWDTGRACPTRCPSWGRAAIAACGSASVTAISG